MEGRGRKRKVLTVDSSASVRTFVWEVLRDDYAVLTTGDWQEALRMVEREGVDVVLVGVDKPPGSYRFFFQVLRGRWPALPILLLLGEGVEREEVFDLGISDGVGKMFMGERLRDKVRGLLFLGGGEGREERFGGDGICLRGVGFEVKGEKRGEEGFLGDEALAMLAHEIKNPLVAINTFAYLLPERYGDEEFRVEFYRLVSKEVRRINELLEVLSEYGRFGICRLVPNDLNLVLLAVLGGTERELGEVGVQVQRELREKMPLVFFDELQLRFVLRSVCSFVGRLGGGGYLRLRTDFIEGGGDWVELRVSLGEGGEGLQVGAGRDNLGLRMLLVRRLMARNGGRIEVLSGEGTETVFCLRFSKAGVKKRGVIRESHA